jgi:hypothetical protein
MRPSVARVSELSIAVGADTYVVTGRLLHPNAAEYLRNAVLLFLANSGDVSPANYRQIEFIPPDPESEYFSYTIEADQKRFPRGSTLFGVAYTIGLGYPAAQTNPQTGTIEFANISAAPSNVALVEIP